jgi:hypothetical protein
MTAIIIAAPYLPHPIRGQEWRDRAGMVISPFLPSIPIAALGFDEAAMGQEWCARDKEQ